MKLATYQNQALRIVTGAYKATRIRQLETEAFIPPVDIWLAARTADFHRRLDCSGIAKLIFSLSAPIRRQVLGRKWRRTGHQPANLQTPLEKAREEILRWFQAQDFESCNTQPKARILDNWKTRWRQETGYRPEGNRMRTSPEPIRQDSEPNAAILQLHKDLCKAESSALVQARTECIGLAQFLYKRKVPGVTTPNCTCSNAPETARHLVQYCAIYPDREGLHQSTVSYRPIDYRQLTGTPQGAKILSKWIIGTGRLLQYSLAKRLPF
jgi:hypothetical protein